MSLIPYYRAKLSSPIIPSQNNVYTRRNTRKLIMDSYFPSINLLFIKILIPNT